MESKRLTRVSDGKMIGGVCTGLARYLDIDVSLVRIGMVLLAVFAQVGWIVYVVLWLVLPESSTGRTGVDGVKDAFGSSSSQTTYNTYPGPTTDASGPQDPPQH